MPQKCVTVRFPYGVDRYVIAWLNCVFAKIFCASHKKVSSEFSLAYCTLESNSRLRKIGYRSSFSWFQRVLMFHSVCCLFHAKSCRLSDREKSSVFLMHQSIPAAPSPSPPGADPRALAFFFCLGWQIPGDGDS